MRYRSCSSVAGIVGAVAVRGAETSLAIADDQIERGAQLVADGSKQARFELVGLFRHCAGLDRLAVQLGVVHRQAQLVGQRLKPDQLLARSLRCRVAVQVEQPA